MEGSIILLLSNCLGSHRVFRICQVHSLFLENIVPLGSDDWVEAGPADRLIAFFPTDQLNFLGVDCSAGECGFVSTFDADCRKFDDLFSQRDQLEDIAKGFALEGAIKGGNDDYNSVIGQLF